jgi:hypothetical protein
MHVIISLHVDLIIKDSMWARDAVELGAGPVVRSIVARIMIRQRVSVWRQRIITINVVDKNLGSARKITALAGIVHIVENGGNVKR